MKKWKIYMEDEKGNFKIRYCEASTLDEASDIIRNRIPITWRIVSVAEASE